MLVVKYCSAHDFSLLCLLCSIDLVTQGLSLIGKIFFMVRKTKEEANKTCQKILDSAIKLFCNNGISKVSIAQIATEAGVSKGAIYHHFTDKAHLLDSLWHQENGEFDDFAKNMLDLNGIQLQQAFIDVTRQWHEHFSNNKRSQQVMLFSLQAFADKNMLEAKCNRDMNYIKNIQVVMQSLKDKDRLHQHIDAESAAMIYFSLFTGYVHLWGQLPEIMTEKNLQSLITSMQLALFKEF